MFLSIVFLICGVVIAALIGAKIVEGRNKRKPAILRLISLGDERTRDLTQRFAHFYSEKKAKMGFFIEKQLPFKTKTLINKANTYIKEKAEKHIGDIRGSKFLRKSDGISEFFKNISEKENGGRIDHDIGVPEENKKDES